MSQNKKDILFVLAFLTPLFVYMWWYGQVTLEMALR